LFYDDACGPNLNDFIMCSAIGRLLSKLSLDVLYMNTVWDTW